MLGQEHPSPPTNSSTHLEIHDSARSLPACLYCGSSLHSNTKLPKLLWIWFWLGWVCMKRSRYIEIGTTTSWLMFSVWYITAELKPLSLSMSLLSFCIKSRQACHWFYHSQRCNGDLQKAPSCNPIFRGQHGYLQKQALKIIEDHFREDVARKKLNGGRSTSTQLVWFVLLIKWQWW